MALPIPYARVLGASFVAAVVLAVLLNLVLHEWVGALHLAVVIVFEAITLVLAVRALVLWIRERRKGDDDPPGRQRDYGLAG